MYKKWLCMHFRNLSTCFKPPWLSERRFCISNPFCKWAPLVLRVPPHHPRVPQKLAVKHPQDPPNCICMLAGTSGTFLVPLAGGPLLSCGGATWVLWLPSPGQIPRPVLALCHARLRGGVAAPGQVVMGVVKCPLSDRQVLQVGAGRMCKPAPHPRPVCTQTCPLPDRPAALPRTWAQTVLISCCLSGDAWISLCTWEDPVPWLPRELLPRKGTSTVRPSSWLHGPFKQNVLCVELNFSMPNSPLSAEANICLLCILPGLFLCFFILQWTHGMSLSVCF